MEEFKAKSHADQKDDPNSAVEGAHAGEVLTEEAVYTTSVNESTLDEAPMANNHWKISSMSSVNLYMSLT